MGQGQQFLLFDEVDFFVQQFNLQLGLHVDFVVGLCVFAVQFRLAVLAHHDRRRGVSRLEGEQQVQQIATLTSQVDAMTLDLKKKAATIASLERDLKIETDKFDAASASLKALQTEAAQLRAQLKVEAQALSDKQVAYNQLTDKTSAEALKLKAEIDALAASQSARAKALEDKEAQVKILTKEVADRHADLNKRLAELEALRKDHASATQEIAKLQHSLKIVTDLNAQAEKDLAQRKALAVELQKQVDDLKVSLQSCQSDASAAVKQCATKTQSLSEELKTLNVRYEKSVGDLADAKAQLKIADADYVSCASEVKIHKSSIASLESKLVQCETDKKSCNEARDAAVQRVQALNKESAEFRHMIKDCSQNHVIPIFTHTHTCRTRSSSPLRPPSPIRMPRLVICSSNLLPRNPV